MSLKLNTASGGSITLQEADTASNLTLTVPAQTGSIVTADSSGNVGVGTSSPSQKLDVRGAITAYDGGTQRTYLSNAGEIELARTDGDAYIDFSTSTAEDFDCRIQQSSNGLRFLTGGNGSASERMRIASNGDVLIGKTASDVTNPGLYVESSSAINYGRINFIKGSASGTSATAACAFYYNGTQVGTITNTGTATAYNTSSDYRLKENIAPMTDALATVQALKPVTYKWKVDGSDGQGFIAHELQAVVPDCVTGEKDAVDEEGNPQYQGIDTSFLVATLTAAIQEQQAIITELKTRIEALESK